MCCSNTVASISARPPSTYTINRRCQYIVQLPELRRASCTLLASQHALIPHWTIIVNCASQHALIPHLTIK